MTISDVVMNPNMNLQRRNPPADEAALKEFLSRCQFKLPNDYIQLIHSINGAEGELAISPGWFQLWPVEEILSLNQSYAVAEFHPDFFGFGSSGGGVMFAFKVDAAGSSKVFGIPFDSIDPNDIRVVANDFLTFANAMGYPWSDDA
jgi:hypothetical protein